MATFVFRTAFALGLCMAFAVPASAEPESRSAVVRVTDLNLADPAGEKTLRRRVSFALTQVCGDAADRNLAARSPIRACRTEAMAKAKPQIEMAVASARTGRAYVVAAIKVARPTS